MTHSAVTPAPDLDAILAARGGARVGRVTFARPRVAMRRNAPHPAFERPEAVPTVGTPVAEAAFPATHAEMPIAEPAWAVDPEPEHPEAGAAETPTAPEAETPTAPEAEAPAAGVPADLRAEGVPLGTVPADATALLLRRMRAVRAAQEKLRLAEEEQMRRHRDLVEAEAELDAELIRVRARLESLAGVVRDNGIRHASSEEVGEVFALLRTQAV